MHKTAHRIKKLLSIIFFQEKKNKILRGTAKLAKCAARKNQVWVYFRGGYFLSRIECFFSETGKTQPS